MHPHADIIMTKYRFPFRVTLLDVRAQGYTGVRSIERAFRPDPSECRVVPNYYNRRTRRCNIDLCFVHEKAREAALDRIDQLFRSYRVQ